MALTKEQRLARLKPKQKAYWLKREKYDKLFLQYEARQIRKNAIIYDTVVSDMTKNIKAFYGEFAKEGVVTYTEAVTPITNKARILREAEKEISRISGDKQYLAYLEGLKKQERITRLEALYFEINKNVYDLAKEAEKSTQEYLAGSYEKNYSYQVAALRTITNRKIPGELAKIRVQKAVFSEFNGLSFSDRIWKNKETMIDTLRGTVTNMFIQQKPIDQATETMIEKFNVSRSAAERIIRTEGARVTEEATLQAYGEAKVEYYIFDSVLDERTSDICEELAGQRFRLDEAQAGVNYPPMHPNCRSTTVPDFGE